MSIENFKSEIARRVGQYKNMGYPTITSEMNTIANALSTDGKVHDQTIVKPMAQLEINSRLQTPFTNFINIIVNKGKASNLLSSDMANALASLAGPPVIITAPVVSGTGTVGSTLTCTQGSWQNFPTGYTFQWMRSGAAIAGATASTHLNVAADSGKSLSCPVTAVNGAGSATSPSNAIAVT
jgi:hypothetical protein